MQKSKSILKRCHSDTVQEGQIVDFANDIMSDYARNLKENINLEKQVATLLLANNNLSVRIAANIVELKKSKDLLNANEERMAALQKIEVMQRQVIAKEQAKFKLESQAKDIVLSDLQEEIIALRRKLRMANGALEQTQARLAHYRDRCRDYKDKLRSFAVLFTYFNDPKRGGGGGDQQQACLVSDSNATYASSASITSATPKERFDQGIQMDIEYCIAPTGRTNIYQKVTHC